MLKKNVLDYLVLALFVMCMGLALCAALDYDTRATNREYLNQGIWLLSMAATALVSFFAVRCVNKAAPHLSRWFKDAVWLILCVGFFAIGLLARLWVIQNIPIEPRSDFETYYRMANELIHGNLLSVEGALDRRYIALYPHTIGFPMLVLVPVFKVFGISVMNALYANLVCSMLSVILCGRIGKRLGGRLGSVLCVALMSLWPSHIFYSNMVATEPSFTLLLLIAFNLIVAVMDRKPGCLYERAPWYNVAWLPLIGILLALAGAIRPMAVILLAAFAVAYLQAPKYNEREVEPSMAHGFLSHRWMCLIIVIVPYLVTGNIISGTISSTIMEKPAGGISASGYNLMVGLNYKNLGLWNQEDADFFAEAYDSTGSASEAHKASIQMAIQRVQSEPENVLDLMVYKFRDLWRTDDFGLDWNLLWTGQQGTLTDELSKLVEDIRPWGRGVYMAVLLFALIGSVQAWQRVRKVEPAMLICMMFFLGTALAHMLLETQVRYHYNMIPFLIFLAVNTAVCWRERMKEEPVVIVRKAGEEDAMTDHTHFDMAAAVHGGNIRMSVSKQYEKAPEGETAMVGNVPVADVRVVESAPPEVPSYKPRRPRPAEAPKPEEAPAAESPSENDKTPQTNGGAINQ